MARCRYRRAVTGRSLENWATRPPSWGIPTGRQVERAIDVGIGRAIEEEVARIGGRRAGRARIQNRDGQPRFHNQLTGKISSPITVRSAHERGAEEPSTAQRSQLSCKPNVGEALTFLC